MAVPISIVILTYNEEVNLADCLESLKAISDVHVLDSGSTDQTLAIAKRNNVKTYFNPFSGFGQQRNWAIKNIETKHPWVLHLDADERMTPELLEEIEVVLAARPSVGGFHVPNKLIFCGRWLKYSSGYPTYQVRLFHSQRLRFTDYGHGQREETNFGLGRLTQPYLHLAFSKGLDSWFAKHAKYARLEAEQAMRELEKPSSISLFSFDGVERRRALKRLAYRLPFRSTLRFLYMLLINRAILDGWAGITYARMVAIYESMMSVNLKMQSKKNCKLPN